VQDQCETIAPEADGQVYLVAERQACTVGRIRSVCLAAVKAIRQTLILLLLLVAGCATRPHDTLFQYSTINALLAGAYDGDMTYGQLRRHGDFGLGTFNTLDGEMVALDGRYYQVPADGNVLTVRDSMRTPFAVVTFFRARRSFSLADAPDFHSLERWLDEKLSSPNAFFAIRIEGEFAYVKARSVPAQQPPYPPLAEVVRNQSVFEWRGVKGTLVGFRTPAFMRDLNVPGYHFHFLSADRQSGGHVLDVAVRRATVEIDQPRRFLVDMPGTAEFHKIDLTHDRGRELQSVEKALPNR